MAIKLYTGGPQEHRRRCILSNEFFAVSLFFHLIATVLWIGGLLITMILVWPAMRRVLEGNPALIQVLSRLRKQFNPISNLALVTLITTGLFQMTASEYYDGFLTFDNTWSKIMLAKHVVIVLMALTGLLLQYWVAPTLERTSMMLQHSQQHHEQATQEWVRLHSRERLLTWVNAFLGVVVLAFSAWLGAL